jgi:hypothetical protein
MCLRNATAGAATGRKPNPHRHPSARPLGQDAPVLASLNPCFPASPGLPKPNSENRSSSAPVKSSRVSNLLFSNSEPIELRHGRPAFTNHHSPVTTHHALPETAKRVEAHVNHRKQSAGYPSTRDSSRHELAPYFRRLSARRQRNFLPCTAPQTFPALGRLIGTRERLETRVSLRKQTVGRPSNRYSSHHQFALIFDPEKSAALPGANHRDAECAKGRGATRKLRTLSGHRSECGARKSRSLTHVREKHATGFGMTALNRKAKRRAHARKPSMGHPASVLGTPEKANPNQPARRRRYTSHESPVTSRRISGRGRGSFPSRWGSCRAFASGRVPRFREFGRRKP